MRQMLYFSLPLVALLFLGIGQVLVLNLPDHKIWGYGLWAAALALMGAWLVMYWQPLKKAMLVGGFGGRMSRFTSTALVIAVVFALGMLTNRTRFNKTFDLTRDGVFTLAPQSIEVAKKMGAQSEGLEVVGFFDQAEPKEKFLDLIQLYQEAGLEVTPLIYNPVEQPTKAMEHDVNVTNSVIFKLSGMEARVNTLTEEKLTNALMKLMKGEPKKVYFTQGHGELSFTSQDEAGLSMIVGELENNSYVVETIDLTEKTPEPGSLLVIAGPQYDLRQGEKELVQGFVKAGGHLFLLVDALRPLPELEALSLELGIKINSDIVLLDPEDPRVSLIGQNNALVTEFEAFHPISKDFARGNGVYLVLPNSRSLEVTESSLSLKGELIGKSSPNMVRIPGIKTKKDLQGLTAERLVTGQFGLFAVASGTVGREDVAKAPDSEERKGDLSADMTGQKNVRVLVAGSSGFATNAGVQRAENFDMFMNGVQYLLEDETFIALRPKSLSSQTLDLASPFSHLNLALVSFVYPFLFLCFGIVVWLRRRNA